MQTQFDGNRQFGVEIETSRTGPSIRTIARALNDAGISTRDVGYTHRTMSTWKVVPDASTGPEIVSPPLRGQAGLDEIARVCEVLQSIGCRVDRSTGLHVHHDFFDGSKKNLKSILFLYAKAQAVTNALLPTRTNSRWGQAVNAEAIEIREPSIERHARAMGNRNDLRYYAVNIQQGRYHAVNSQAFAGHGTVEFRQHSGSLNASKIQAWVVFTQNIVTSGMAKKVSRSAVLSSRRAGGSPAQQLLSELGRDSNCDVVKKARQNIVQRIYENAERGRGGLTLNTLSEFLGATIKYLTPAQRRILRQLNSCTERPVPCSWRCRSGNC